MFLRLRFLQADWNAQAKIRDFTGRAWIFASATQDTQ
jgi:hypothetical protein